MIDSLILILFVLVFFALGLWAGAAVRMSKGRGDYQYMSYQAGFREGEAAGRNRKRDDKGRFLK